MNLVQKLKNWLFERKLKQATLTNKTKHQSVHFDKAKTIGLLFDGTELPEREKVLAYAARLKKEGKRVKLLAFMDNKVDNSGFTFKSFNRDELDFSNCPKSDEVKTFINEPLDLLINLSLRPTSPFKLILASSKARFRVGLYDPTANFYELMIDLPAKNDINKFISQVEVYLNKMQTTYEAAV